MRGPFSPPPWEMGTGEGDAWSTGFPQEVGTHMKVIDARDLEPPEPFERVMEAISGLAPGERVMLILNREPFPLYRVLRLNGYQHKTTVFPDGRFEIVITQDEAQEQGGS